MSAANKITLLHIVLIPLLLAFMVPDSVIDRWIALTIFLLASATDWLDGYVARSRRQVTPLGKLLDPVADKLLVTAALLPLVRKELVPDFLAALLIGREFLVTGLRSVASAEGVVIPAGRVGKWKMGISITAISFLIVTPRNPANTWRSYHGGFMVSQQEREQLIATGMQALDKAVVIDPEYFEAMSYINLLYREQAKLLATLGKNLEAGEAYMKADEYMKKALEIRKKKLPGAPAQAPPAKA